MPVPVPYVDILAGGFPCQDISVAGRGEGIDGQRSGLWGEYARLIRELRPRYVVVENVSALLARGMDRVLGDLAACGYDAEWDCIPASAVGAPHRRDRVWIVAYPAGMHGDGGRVHARSGSEGAHAVSEPGDGRAAASVADPARDLLAERPDTRAVGQRTRQGGQPGRDMADPAGEGRGSARPVRPEETRGTGPLGESARSGRRQPQPRMGRLVDGFPDGLAGPWNREPDIPRVAVGVPERVDKLRALGNALVPQIAQWLGERIVAYEAERAMSEVAA